MSNRQGEGGGLVSSLSQTITRFYDQQAEQEWARMDRHPTEFAVTLRALSEHLRPPPARVLDCGGGPGRYAIELTRQGYSVTLFDLSGECLRLAQEKAAEAGVALQGYEQGEATDLSRYPDDAFDAVLLMGPLYHLLKEGDRRQALAEARRVLKPGGPLFAAFISRYAVHRWAAAHEPTWPLEQTDNFEAILSAGVEPPGAEDGSAFVAYFAHPTEVIPLCQHVGLEIVTVLGVEGLVSMIEEGVNALSGEAWDTWVDLNCRVAADPCIHGCVEHLLAVALKPRWRAVVRQIAAQLNEAGVAYQVIGRASAALHGAPVSVEGVDLATDIAGAGRFRALFADHLVGPVGLCERESQRSHLCRFDFDRLAVKVVGDLHRDRAGSSVPAVPTAQIKVDLDGVPVPVSRLEEETLTCLRRGQLDWAAECLPHCDPDRLSALLRGEQAPCGR